MTRVRIGAHVILPASRARIPYPAVVDQVRDPRPPEHFAIVCEEPIQEALHVRRTVINAPVPRLAELVPAGASQGAIAKNTCIVSAKPCEDVVTKERDPWLDREVASSLALERRERLCW